MLMAKLFCMPSPPGTTTISGPRQLAGPVEWMEVDRSANVVRAAIDNEPIEILRPTDFVGSDFLKALED